MAKVLKILSPFISPILLKCFNDCIINSCFPHGLKQADIIPVPKKPKPKDNADYRPISIQSILSKVFESALLKQIQAFVDKTNPFQHQFGFRPGFSTVSLLRQTNNIINNNLKKGLLTILISLDFSKAFDTIAHHILLTKISSLGFSQSATK